jgi:hypothetical protein
MQETPGYRNQFSRDTALPSPTPIARLPAEAESGGVLLRFNHRVTTVRRHHQVAAHGIGEMPLHAARKARVARCTRSTSPAANGFGRSLPILEPPAKMALHQVPEMFAIFAKFAFFNRAEGKGQEPLLTSR